MKWSLRLFAALFLLTISLMTHARRADSGTWIAFVSDRGGHEGIYLMTGDGGSVTRITPEHMCAATPNWSPDGEWIAFADICSAEPRLLRMRPGGSQPRPITDMERFTVGEWSPDSQHIAVTRRKSDLFSLYVVEANGPGERFLAEDYHVVEWSPDGTWLYVVPLSNDVNSLDRIHVETGRVERVLEGSGRVIWLSWSPDAAEMMLVVRNHLIRMRPDGSDITTVPVNLLSQGLRAPRWSPDGEWIAFEGGQTFGRHHIYRVRPDGRDLRLLTRQAGNTWNLQWSPDGDWLLFMADYGHGSDIYRLRADGSSLQNLTPGSGRDFAPQYAPVAGSGWHPALMMVAALGTLVTTMTGRVLR